MAKTQTQADRELNWLKGTTFPSSPATLYLALLTSLPTLSTAGTEVTGGSYGRVAITSSSGWSAISTVNGRRQISNAGDIVFPTASADWAPDTAPVIAWSLRDASTAGNRIRYGLFTTPFAVLNGQTAKVLAGQLVIVEP